MLDEIAVSGGRLKSGASPNTISWYKEKGKPFALWLDEKGIKPEDFHRRDVNAYIKHIKKTKPHYAEGTINQIKRAMRRFCYFAYEEEITPRRVKVVVGKTPKKPKPWIAEDEWGQIFAAVETAHSRNYRRTYAILFLLKETMLRRSEIVGLDWGDIKYSEDSDIGKLTVQAEVSKTRERQEIYFSHRTWEALKDLRTSMRRRGKPTGPNGPVFISERGIGGLFVSNLSHRPL
jgi:integrase